MLHVSLKELYILGNHAKEKSVPLSWLLFSISGLRWKSRDLGRHLLPRADCIPSHICSDFAVSMPAHSCGPHLEATVLTLAGWGCLTMTGFRNHRDQSSKLSWPLQLCNLGHTSCLLYISLYLTLKRRFKKKKDKKKRGDKNTYLPTLQVLSISGLLHYMQILYHLSHQGSPYSLPRMPERSPVPTN